MVMRKSVAGFSLGVLLCVACGAPDPQGRATTPGGAIFMAECAICHGKDGTLGMGGAKNLALTTLSDEEMAAVVVHGKGGMAGFGDVLTPEQIEEVVHHVRSLRVDPIDGNSGR